MNILTFSEGSFNRMLSSGVSEHFSMSGDGNGVFFELTMQLQSTIFQNIPCEAKETKQPNMYPSSFRP